MHGKITIGIVLLSLILILTACSGTSSPAASAAAANIPVNQTPASQTDPAPVTLTPVSQPVPVAAVSNKPSGPIKATEIVPTVANDTVTIPVSAVQKDWNVHFSVDIPGAKESFMAYNLDGQTYVRASICPPCRGKTYTLSGSTLVCDVCATTFNAQTGSGHRRRLCQLPQGLGPLPGQQRQYRHESERPGTGLSKYIEAWTALIRNSPIIDRAAVLKRRPFFVPGTAF